MNLKHLFALGLAALPLALATPALANPDLIGQRGLSDSFAAMDYNHDGKVDRDEFTRAHPNLRPEAFTAIDGNKDMFITREEWDKFAKGHKKDMTMPAPEKGMKAMPPKDGKASMITPPKGGAKGDNPMPPAAK